MKTYTVKEIADMLNTNPETVRRWIRNGKLHAEKSSNKSGNVILETSLNTFASTMPKYQKTINSSISNSLIGAGAILAGSILTGIIANKNEHDQINFDDKTILQLLNNEISNTKHRIENKENSLHQLEKEIEEERIKLEKLIYLLSQKSRKDKLL